MRPTRAISGGQAGDLPVPAHSGSAHACGLRLREVSAHLAYRCAESCLPPFVTAPTPPTTTISDLNTQPTPTLANAPPPDSRLTADGPGQGRRAMPSPYGTSLR